MNNLFPKIKTIRIMLQEVDEQQEVVFRMVFKMYNTTNYEIVTSELVDQPGLILVDTDTEKGIEVQKTLRKEYPTVSVAMFSSAEPNVITPYLPKPIKFDTLFPILRSLSQGGNVFEPSSRQSKGSTDNEDKQITSRKAVIRRFNPQKGLLGVLKFASQGYQDIAVLHDGKPVLIVFPSIQRVSLTISTTDLEKLCEDGDVSVTCKTVPDNPQWKEKAEVTIISCSWQTAIWTVQGRLIYPMTSHTVFTLERQPNLTHLAHVPESMRLSAFPTKTSVNLNILYKVVPLGMPDILNYLAATSITGFLATDSEYTTGQANVSAVATEQIGVNSDVPDDQTAKDVEKMAGSSKEQPRGLLQRLMRKLLEGHQEGQVMKGNKIMFTGPVDVGKTTAISALLDEPPVQTDADASDMTLVHKGYTTVVMDYGVIHLDEEAKVHLYGTPGQKRFNFIREILSQGSMGLALLLDNTRTNPLRNLQSFLDTFKELLKSAPLVVGITKVDIRSLPGVDMYQKYLTQNNFNVPVFEIDARREDDVKQLASAMLFSIDPGLEI